METLFYKEDAEIVIFRDALNKELVSTDINSLFHDLSSDTFKPNAIMDDHVVSGITKTTCIVITHESRLMLSPMTKQAPVIRLDVDIGDVIYFWGNIDKYYCVSHGDYVQFYESSKRPVVDDTSDLYDDSTVLCFYSKSADLPFPGKGSGEKMESGLSRFYERLAKITGWRKMLSNFWIKPFMLDGHEWASVEHYYQGSKFKIGNHDYYLEFSLDSDSDLSKDPAMAKTAGGKTGGKIRPKHIAADLDFFGGRDKIEMYNAQYSKFSQNEELKDVLLSTNDAKLTHFRRGQDAEVFITLMQVRQELRDGH